MFWDGLCLFVLLVLTPSTAYAYLDPGSGNALVSLLVVILGSLGYVCRATWYKLKALICRQGSDRARYKINSHKYPLVIFSEGRNYYTTFRPIIDEILLRKCPVFYVTLDLEDPMLLLQHDLFSAKYLGEGPLAYARMGRIRARMMLSTTPNIGSPGFPLARPRYIDNLAHVCHAVSGLGNYHRYSLDSYDTVLMPGEFMREEVRQIERLRGLPEKSCVSVGLPYLDVLAAKASARRARPSASPVILIAPSWGSKNFLRVCGSDFISAITQENYQVIIRPHPHSWIAEPEFLRELEKKIAGCSNAWIDREVDGSESLNRADLLISGRSAVRFDFAFLYEKPVLSVKLPLEDMREYEFSDLGEIWEDRAQYLLGPVIEPDADAELILAKISEALKFTPRSISELREQTVANFGSSSQVIASWCLGQLQEAQ